MSKSSPLMVLWWPLAQEQIRAEEEGRVPMVRFEVVGNTGGTINQGTQALNRLPADLPCLVLVAPAEVSLIPLTPPKLSGKKLKDALPFLVEPHLLNDPEENLVTLWPGLLNDPSQGLAAVISKARVRSIAGACKQFGLDLAAISCETLRRVDRASAWASSGQLILADGQSAPIAIPLDQPAVVKAMLGRKLASQSGASPVLPEVSAGQEAELSPWLNEGLLKSGKPVIDNLNTLLSRALCSSDELRRLGIKINAGALGGWGPLWKSLAVLATVCVIGLNALSFKVQQTEEDLRQQIKTAFNKALPGTPMVADPLLLIDRAKKQLNAGTQTTQAEGVSLLLHETALALDDAPFNSLVRLEWLGNKMSLHFNPNVGENMQEAALDKLKGKPVIAKWILPSGETGPVLQIQWKQR